MAVISVCHSAGLAARRRPWVQAAVGDAGVAEVLAVVVEGNDADLAGKAIVDLLQYRFLELQHRKKGLSSLPIFKN